MRAQKLIPLQVAAAGFSTDHNSFTDVSVDDDFGSIPDNPTEGQDRDSR